MRIAGITPESKIDYPEKCGPVIFTLGCNYRCPTCHNSFISRKGISQESFEKFFKNLKVKAEHEWYNGVTISGGEPTLQHDLYEFLRRIKKETNLAVKLDTNGSNPFILGDLHKEKLVDYVALDIKGPPSIYRSLIGIENGDGNFDFRDNLEKAINAVQNFPDFEFRTTVVPVIRENKNCTFMTKEEAEEMRDYVRGFVFTDRRDIKWYLQKFVARKKSENAMLDERFAKENLQKEYQETPQELLVQYEEILKNYFPKAEIR